jgi:hypothetical protein
MLDRRPGTYRELIRVVLKIVYDAKKSSDVVIEY